MPPIETNPALSGSSASTPVNVKLLLIGNASVGKSSLLLRFSDEAWIPEDEATATIGVDFRVSAPRCFVGHVVPRLSCMTPWKGVRLDTDNACTTIGPQDGSEWAESKA